MDKNLDSCLPSTTGEHHWRPYLSGGYICVYCGQQWVPVEPCVDPDEIDAKSWEPEPEPEPWWENWLLVAVALLVLLLVFAPLGV